VKPFRTENISHTKHYVDAVLNGRAAVHDRELVGPAIELAETVVLGLRLLTDGIDLDQIGRRLGINASALYQAEVAELSSMGLLDSSSGRLTLPEAAVPVATKYGSASSLPAWALCRVLYPQVDKDWGKL
jgi:oxygen-independent coproporphyrinogen-3 oxidase